jgi:hypothetical protein
MTPTIPLPVEASDVSWLSALNEGVMSPTVRDGAALAELELAGAELAGAELVLPPAAVELLLELQAAISSAALTPTAARPALFMREDTNIPRFFVHAVRPGESRALPRE